jgi:uncharacterized protein (TIGR03435 family)
MRPALILTAALTLLTTTQAPAQTKSPAFDVATIRVSAPLDPAKLQADMQAGRMPRFGAHVDASRAEYTYMTLRDLIANAYDLKPYQITGPDTLTAQRFDIVATLPDGASKDDAPRTLQELLADRFKLTLHRETAEHPVLALIVARGGPKLTEAAPSAPLDDDTPLKPGEMKIDTPDGPARMTRNSDGSMVFNMGTKGTMTQRIDLESKSLHLDASSLTMQGFADMLTNVTQMGNPGGGRQVVDMTGLKGSYQVSIDFSLAELMAAAKAAGALPAGAATPAASLGVASDPTGSDVYASVQKLGLKLEPRKAPIEQLIVDHVEKTPTDN